jgi:hypothetical protein
MSCASRCRALAAAESFVRTPHRSYDLKGGQRDSSLLGMPGVGEMVHRPISDYARACRFEKEQIRFA